MNWPTALTDVLIVVMIVMLVVMRRWEGRKYRNTNTTIDAFRSSLNSRINIVAASVDSMYKFLFTNMTEPEDPVELAVYLDKVRSVDFDNHDGIITLYCSETDTVGATIAIPHEMWDNLADRVSKARASEATIAANDAEAATEGPAMRPPPRHLLHELRPSQPLSQVARPSSLRADLTDDPDAH